MNIKEIIFKPKNIINSRWSLICIEISYFIKSSIDKLIDKLGKGRDCGHTLRCRNVKVCSLIDYCCKLDMYGGVDYGIIHEWDYL